MRYKLQDGFRCPTQVVIRGNKVKTINNNDVRGKMLNYLDEPKYLRIKILKESIKKGRKIKKTMTVTSHIFEKRRKCL